MERRFGSTAPFTTGVEEEFQLVDPHTRELAQAIEAVIGAAPDGSERMGRELFQNCVELRTPVFSDVAGLARQLPGLRGEVAKAANKAGVRISGGGLHVHVGVPDEEAAIRATNALLRHVPILTALGANSPFWNGMDTGFASARVKIRDASPRSGLPPNFQSWDEFEGYTDALVAMGNIPDSSWFWWDVRPHPRHGTVELRVPDAQADPNYAVALAALTQCLVATAEEHAPQDARFVSENKWRAIRRGLDARLYDFDTREEKGARETARNLVARLRPVSQDLGCEEELGGVLEILDRGNGAELQRAAYERRGSLQDVVDHLLDTTAPA
jgi:carboxylate-amine ligase